MKNVLPPFLNSTFYILNFTFTFEIPPLASLGRDDKSSLFSPLSLAFTLFKGEGGPLAVDEGCPDLTISTAPKSRMVSPHLVAGKAPWQTVRYACRLARCACRSSSQKVLRYFLGALYTRASFPLRGKPCIEPCSEQLTVLYKIPPLASLGRDDMGRVVTTGRAGGVDKCGRAPSAIARRAGGAGCERKIGERPSSVGYAATFPQGGRQGRGRVA